MLDLGLQVAEGGLLLLLLLAVESVNDFRGLLGAEVRFLVLDVLHALCLATQLVVQNLLLDEFLVLPVGLQLELTLGLHEHILLVDVLKEHVAFVFAQLLGLVQVALETLVGLVARLLLDGVDVLALVLGVVVNAVGARRVHEVGVAGVVRI